MNWINKNWAKLGGFMAIVIMAYTLVSYALITHIESLLWIHVAVLQLHQFEEYVYPGTFKTFYNEHIFGKNSITRFPLNDNGIIIVNVVLAWPAHISSALFGEKQLWLAMGLLCITIACHHVYFKKDL
jgi:hypothetical protein